MSGLGVFFLLLFILFIIYFFGGMMILRSRGAEGLEMIPHVTFWMSVPARIRDSVKYCMNGCKPPEDSYEAIWSHIMLSYIVLPAIWLSLMSMNGYKQSENHLWRPIFYVHINPTIFCFFYFYSLLSLRGYLITGCGYGRCVVRTYEIFCQLTVTSLATQQQTVFVP